MTIQEKAQNIIDYINTTNFNIGLSVPWDTDINNYKFRLANINDNYSNYFEVCSEEEAKEIAKLLIKDSFTEDIFNDYKFPNYRNLYLVVDIFRPV
jgi:hypothetical protein